MCEPLAIAAGISAATALYGTVQSAKASQQQSRAITEANQATARAQNEGFSTRINAGLRRSQDQSAALNQTLSARREAALGTRTQQLEKLQDYRDLINEQNTQAEGLRARGDTAATQLTKETSAANLTDAETQRRQQAADLLSANLPDSPETSDPNNAVSSDTVAGKSLARRTAEAATNIRNYGSKISQVGSYGAAPEAVNLAVADTRYGIMPAVAADKLLRSGSATRLLPAQIGYTAASELGKAQDTLLSSEGQAALDAAGLSYGNAADLSSLKQSNATTIAKNRLGQTTADLDYKKSQGQVLQGLGQLGLYGAGYYGGDPLEAGGLDYGGGGENGTAPVSGARYGGGFLSRLFT